MLSINEDSEFVYSENFFKKGFWFIFFITYLFLSKWFLILFLFLSLHVILNLIQDLIYFFQNAFIPSLFLFFHKNYYHFTKGKEPAQSPKPAVSFPLNPFLLGHGLGHRPKNLATSKIEVSSVSCEQIRVEIFHSDHLFPYDSGSFLQSSLCLGNNWVSIKKIVYSQLCLDFMIILM